MLNVVLRYCTPLHDPAKRFNIIISLIFKAQKFKFYDMVSLAINYFLANNESLYFAFKILVYPYILKQSSFSKGDQ